MVLPLAMAAAASADEVTDWHEHLLVALAKGGGNSQVRSRNAAMVSAAVFDAVNGIERRYEPILVPARCATRRFQAGRGRAGRLRDTARQVPTTSCGISWQAGGLTDRHWRTG